ncbi:histidine kinase [Flavobacterium sp. JP2137]|uniref:sensor histidine kinase n=1 Tax=Flavobacterium sp. JP2137 TaxID=3414510 RepID=UPI003D3012AF
MSFFKFKKPIERRTLLLISFPILLITVIALLVLSVLITQNSEDINTDIAKKTFFKRNKALENEFIRIDQHQNLLHGIASRNSGKALRDKFEILNEISHSNFLIDSNWFVDLDTAQNIVDSYMRSSGIESEAAFRQWLLEAPPQNNRETLIASRDSLYWIISNSIPTSKHTRRVYGYTINLQKLHEYLATIDASTPNYAYIFDKNGICIFHPEIEMIGKNVFELTNLNPTDTLIDKNFQNPPIVMSEFLHIDVIRFVNSFKTKNFDGYICVNFPKINSDEIVAEVKTYTTLIFLTTVFLILFIFYLFDQANRKAYKEKELLAVENEKFSKEKALTQLQQLKNQINPHFLFNSLNSLYMLIAIDKKNAQTFTLNLSKIYRYLINPPAENAVPLQDEINFIQEYISLQKSRFSEELIFKITGESEANSGLYLPYLALQITIENALKHNIATLEHPLSIHIQVQEDRVLVINNLQKKTSPSESERFGLKYLQKIYQFYDCDRFKIEIKNEHFICTLPLIKC